MVIRVFVTLLLYQALYILCNSPDLWLISGFTNDKEICYCFIDLSQIKGNDILPFFILDGGNYGFDDL